MAADIHVLLGIVIPAVVAIIVALIRAKSKQVITTENHPPTPMEILDHEVRDLKVELERQHIKIDDITERLAWLEGRDSKK
jgi:hypothetical protein